MKNKIEFKKTIIKIVIIIAIELIVISLFHFYQYKTYTTNFNNKIGSIIAKIENDYPNITTNELIEILNSENDVDINLFRNYGIDINKESILLNNNKSFTIFAICMLIIIIIFKLLIIILFLKYNYNKDKSLKKITKYIEEINNRNYRLDIDDNTEDELSILKNEVYKTTVMLKEIAENSVNDKINLKDSLSDISHQLKTPLSSITIMIDNILDNPNIDKKTQMEFLNNIKRQILNINFLINSLLKLSKLDADTVKFSNKEYLVEYIINQAVNNVSILSDLKNVKINIYGNSTSKIYCDAKWQTEAITNILKNGIEHSNEGEVVDIYFEENKIYSQIKIKDYGIGIDEKDLPHIFERFYKGKNSSNDSIGIGLALSKSIIEKNNGNIDVISELNKGTEFIIKYFK